MSEVHLFIPEPSTSSPTQYNLNFYLQYLVRWPEYFEITETAAGRFNP
jgi:hypothetical protein